MIENVKIHNNKDLAKFVIDAICDADLRYKMQDVPDILDNNREFNVDEFIDTIGKNIDKEPGLEIQNDSMLFVELLLKGNLTVTPRQLNMLSELTK